MTRPLVTRGMGAFLLTGVAALAVPVIVDRIAATVDDIAIPESELRKAIVVSGLPRNPGESEDAYRARVLDELVDQHLQYEDAQRFGPAPPDAAEIDAAMAALEKRLREAGKNPAEEFARAGMTREEVRSSVERQLLIQRYLRERFTPIALADETRAREEYESFYVPGRRAAGLPPQPFEAVLEEMRKAAQTRVFEEEVEKWRAELRQRARVAVYRIPVPLPTERERIVLSSITRTTPTPTPAAR